YVDNPFITVIQQHLPVIILLSFAFSVVYISRTVVMDKELRVKEYMRVMGLKFWVHSAAHFICNFLKLAFISTMLTLFLCISINDKKILVKSDPSAVLFFFLIYSATSVCYCFVVGSFFKNGTVEFKKFKQRSRRLYRFGLVFLVLAVFFHTASLRFCASIDQTVDMFACEFSHVLWYTVDWYTRGSE
ncbi:hypothetical protein D917_09280, partial [Trichinella nativa]